MSDAAPAPSSDAPDDTLTTAPTQPGKRRGRPPRNTSDTRKPETPRQRFDQLKADLERAQTALREFEARRDSVVGRVVVAHALADPDFRQQLAELLRREVTGKADLAVVHDLLS